MRDVQHLNWSALVSPSMFGGSVVSRCREALVDAIRSGENGTIEGNWARTPSVLPYVVAAGESGQRVSLLTVVANKKNPTTVAPQPRAQRWWKHRRCSNPSGLLYIRANEACTERGHNGKRWERRQRWWCQVKRRLIAKATNRIEREPQV